MTEEESDKVRYSDSKLLDFENTLDGLVKVTDNLTGITNNLIETVGEMSKDTKEVKEIVGAWKKAKLSAELIHSLKKALAWFAGLSVSLAAIYAAYKAGMK